MERLASDWLKIFVKHISDKELNPEHTQKTRNTIIFKTMCKKFKKIFQERIEQISLHKDIHI